MDRPCRTLHSVDQQSVEIAYLDGKFALAEEIFLRVGSFEPGDIENSHIDRRYSDVGFFAWRQACDFDRKRERLPRARDFWSAEREVELARGRVDAEPGQAKRTARHSFGFRIKRTVGNRDGIGAGSPIRANLE